MGKVGRPKKENARRGRLEIRLNNDEMKQLINLCMLTGKKQSEVIRESVAMAAKNMFKEE